jgi:hypothetical protein
MKVNDAVNLSDLPVKIATRLGNLFKNFYFEGQ